MAAIVQAAVALLGQRPYASMEEIAAAAGVTRQTIYAHHPTRKALLQAVTRHITAEVAGELDTLDLEGTSATEALRRWLETSWALLQRYPVLLTPAIATSDEHDEVQAHEPITAGLVRVIERGRRRREFDRKMPSTWYVAAVIGLGHAAGQEVTAGRMTAQRAGIAFRDSALRICQSPR
jgi:AcrR family transcriptional regulator